MITNIYTVILLFGWSMWFGYCIAEIAEHIIMIWRLERLLKWSYDNEPKHRGKL